jgi:hypothetical protein
MKAKRKHSAGSRPAGFIRDLSGIYPGFIRDIYPGFIRDLSGIHLVFIRDLSGIYPGFIRDLSGIYLGLFIWDLSGI